MSKHLWIGAALAAAIAACGGGGGTGGNGGAGGGAMNMRNPDAPPPAIDDTLAIQDLTADQLGQLCDWYAEMVAGGYNQVECPGVTSLPTSGSRENCVANAQSNNAGCDSSVGDWIFCAQALGAVDPCDSAGFVAAQGMDDCLIYYQQTAVCSNIN